jgi:hypothetical protein
MVKSNYRLLFYKLLIRDGSEIKLQEVRQMMYSRRATTMQKISKYDGFQREQLKCNVENVFAYHKAQAAARAQIPTIPMEIEHILKPPVFPLLIEGSRERYCL